MSRYRLAGAAADEIIATCFGSKRRDHRFWAYFCYHHDIENILEKAREYASMARQREIHNPVTAFNHWLVTTFPEGAR